METRAHHVIIGFFTLFVISAALLFSLWLTKSGSDRQFKQYDVVFSEAVSGLSQGSSVQYSGIRVGEVTQLRLDDQNPSKVWRELEFRPLRPSEKILRPGWQWQESPVLRISSLVAERNPARYWKARTAKFR
ncbi:mce related protein [Budvicia aquatica]|uniref:Mce related protein n=1 Tax=Budvicia aquatica TaxID=82979 RepID=A0A484ZPH3_9GAMM|nr:MlaD family protein [Budvicia aquatica]VFS49661.1 mce related protein [Budvicia aquatica]